MVQQRRAVLLVPVILASTVAWAAAGSAQAATPRWRIAASPNPSTSNNILTAVVMTRGHGWAVGGYQGAHGIRTLLERYSAARGRWAVVSSPHPARVGELTAVAGDDANAWAVGSRFALHWNGSEWRAVSVPRVHGGRLTGVSIRSPRDVWAVGSRTTSSGAPLPWTVRWNGQRWATVSAPNPGTGGAGLPRTAFFTGVAALPGTTQVIAVGTANSYGRGAGNAFIERWTGHKWVIVSVPSVPGHVDYLNSVIALSHSNAWAVGSVYNAAPHTLALHWNGKRWNRVSTPDPGNGEFTALAASNARSLWAVGDDQPHGSTWTKPLIEHWNGHSWRNADAPASPIGTPGNCGFSDAYQGLHGIATTPGSSAATAVGYHDALTCGTPRRTLIMQRP